MSPFLIFSLCRSRSSWLSVLLTTDRSICLHDHAAYSRALPEFPGYDYVGMACTGAAIEFEHWRQQYPSAPVVVVRRDPLQASYGLVRATHEPLDAVVKMARQVDKALAEIEKVAGVLSVPFEALDDRAEEIFRFCLPSLEPSKPRLALLLEMNIQPHPPRMRAEIARLRGEGWQRA